MQWIWIRIWPNSFSQMTFFCFWICVHLHFSWKDWPRNVAIMSNVTVIIEKVKPWRLFILQFIKILVQDHRRHHRDLHWDESREDDPPKNFQLSNYWNKLHRHSHHHSHQNYHLCLCLFGLFLKSKVKKKSNMFSTLSNMFICSPIPVRGAVARKVRMSVY